jgi:hypothetical protein
MDGVREYTMFGGPDHLVYSEDTLRTKEMCYTAASYEASNVALKRTNNVKKWKEGHSPLPNGEHEQ